MTQNQEWKEEQLKKFDEYFVEMHPMYGHDMHNKPILYDTDSEDVLKIKAFLSQALDSQLAFLQSRMPKKKETDGVQIGFPNLENIGFNEAVDQQQEVFK